MRIVAVEPLDLYEPWRYGREPVQLGGGPALDALPLRLPALRPPERRGPLSVSHVRSVFAAILDARSGVRPMSRVQGVVHARLYRRLALYRPLRDVRFTLKSVRLCRVAAGVYEACGTAHTARRAYGVMGRFELSASGWRCVLFDLVRPPLGR